LNRERSRGVAADISRPWPSLANIDELEQFTVDARRVPEPFDAARRRGAGRSSSTGSSNIDHDAYACSRDFSIGLDAEPAIFEFPRGSVDDEARYAEDDSVVHLDSADLAEDGEHGLRIWIAETEKIKIARGPKRVLEPRRGAFEDESRAVPRGAQAVE
jgi:hypothetical protein